MTELDVLIVDDHEAMRALLRSVLARVGIGDIRDARSGADALRLISERAPDLILCDVRMPEMDGLVFAAHVRTILSPEACPIIMITGQGSSVARAEALAAGADAFLVKPVSPRDLLAAIEALYP